MKEIAKDLIFFFHDLVTEYVCQGVLHNKCHVKLTPLSCFLYFWNFGVISHSLSTQSFNLQQNQVLWIFAKKKRIVETPCMVIY